MKIIGTFGVVVIASIALLQPAQGRSRGSGQSRGGGHSFSSGHHHSASAGRYSSRPSNSSGGTARFDRNRAYSASRSSPRFASRAAFRNRAYSGSGQRLAVNRTTALNPKASSASRPQVAAGRRAALGSQDFNNNRGSVPAQYTRNWDRGRDHFWRGRRCHWRNNAWVILGTGFYPWGYGYGYGYYPYGAYSYYDGGYYDDGYASSEYPQSEYDSGNSDSSVSQVQAALAREGYYDGAIDGSLGPATRNALRRYQRDRGLSVTGRIDRSVIEALRLR